MSRSLSRPALMLGACLAILATPDTMAHGLGARHGPQAAIVTSAEIPGLTSRAIGVRHGQQVAIVTPPGHAGQPHGHHPGGVTVVPGTAIVVPGQRCDTVRPRGARLAPGSAYASGWNPHSHYTRGHLPPSHYHGGGPSPPFHGRDAAYGRTRIEIRFGRPASPRH